jgi:hypothetical protein
MKILGLRLFRHILLALAAVALFAPGAMAAQSNYRPFKATIAITEQLLQGTDCPWMIGDISGLGQATHLGKVTLVGRDCIIPSSETTFSFSSIQPLILTAANRDQIFAEYYGTLTAEAGIATITGGYKIIGGTGRFSQATGAGSVQGIHNINVSPATGQIQLSGTLVY